MVRVRVRIRVRVRVRVVVRVGVRANMWAKVRLRLTDGGIGRRAHAAHRPGGGGTAATDLLRVRVRVRVRTAATDLARTAW